MEEWVRAKVAALALDTDVYVEYVKGILEDEDMELVERVQSVVSILTSASDGVADDATLAKVLDEAQMVHDVEALVQQSARQQQQEEDMRRAEVQLRELQIREQEIKEAELAQEREKAKALARRNMYDYCHGIGRVCTFSPTLVAVRSREELMAREKLISEYGFSAISEFDEEGNLIKTNDKVSRLVWQPRVVQCVACHSSPCTMQQ